MGIHIPTTQCKVCGLPRFINTVFKWHDNGTITANPRLWGSNFRVVIIQSNFVNRLLDVFENRFDAPVDEIAYEAQRHSTMAVYKPFYDKIPGMKMVARSKSGRRFLLRLSNEVAGLLGMCGVKLLEYVPGEYGVAEINNPFNEKLLAAIVAGDFELLELKPYVVKRELRSEDEFIFRAEAAGEYSEHSEKLAFEASEDPLWFPSIFKRSLAVIPGKVDHDRCPKCGAPGGLSRLEWVEDGVIMDSPSNSRVAFLDGYTLNIILRELAGEAGDNAPAKLVDIVREFTRDNADLLGSVSGNYLDNSKGLAEPLMEFLNNLPILGQGNPVQLEIDGLQVRVIVDNPYDVHILSGTLQGLYESITGGDSLVDWEQRTDVRIACAMEPA